mmetsp:Transcript_58273/g.130117  ORF Transcript_58273/g.130117 Transcript_58273/m.130117 type:complete len:351 (+) Transcript_58273:167-1219(+)
MQDAEAWDTDLSAADVEAPVPKVPIGVTPASAESFGCIEMLGVMPPPEAGWRKSDPKGLWLSNKIATDWIYNITEEKYYHAASKSWWEKRLLESQDPKAPPYTFVRTDAFHLSALRHFAASLDSGALPLAWKSWTLYVKKKKAAVQIAAAPVVEEVPAGVPEEGGQPLEPPAVPLPAAALEEKVDEPPPQAPGPVAGVLREPSMASFPEVDEAEEPTPRPKAKNSKKKGCCLCFRSRPVVESESEEESDDESSPLLVPNASSKGEPAPAKLPPPSERTTSTSAGTASQDVVDTSRVGMETPKKEEAPRCPADELQTRRLQSLLTDISRNPQRLVTHVERRRADKTAVSFM